MRASLVALLLFSACRGPVSTVPEGEILPDVWQLAAFRNNVVRLGLPGENSIATLVSDDLWAVPTSNGAVQTNFRGPVSYKLHPVFEANNAAETAGAPDMAMIDDNDLGAGFWAVVVYESYPPGTPANSTVSIDVYDVRTGQSVLHVLPTVGFGHAPRVATRRTSGVWYSITVYVRESDDKLIAAVHNLEDLGSGAPTLTEIGTASTVHLLDIMPYGSDVLITYVNVDDAAHVVQFNPITGVVQESVLQNESSADVEPDLLLSFIQDDASSGKLAVVTADSTNGLMSHWDFPVPTGSPIQAANSVVLDSSAEAKTYPTISDRGIRNVCAFTTSASASGKFTVLYDFIGLPLTRGTVERADVNASTVTGDTYWYGAQLRSRAFVSGDNHFALVAFANPQEPTAYQGSYFLLRVGTSLSDGDRMAPIAELARWSGGGYTELPNQLSSVTLGVDGNIYMAATVVTNITSPDLTTGIIRGVDVISFTFRTAPETELCRPLEVLDWLLVPGGTLMMFDGRTYGEASFATRPSAPSVTKSAGGSVEDGEHLYVIVYAFTDNAGRTWRGSQSLPFAITMGGGDNTGVVVWEPLHFTGRTNIVAEIYRTAVGAPAQFNRVAVVANSPFTLTQTYNDTMSDATAATGVELYTDGGGLDNQAIAGMKLLAVFDNRVWGVTFEDPETLWYTDEMSLGLGLVWNDVLTLDENDERGEIKSITGFEGALVVQKGDATYALTGSGPNGAGQGGNYSIRRISAAIGTRDPQSAVVADDGVWFNAGGQRSGIHKVTRGLSVEYVGQGVRRYIDETITSAVLVPEYDQIRWFTASGRTLVWDMTSNLWSTNTEQACDSAIVIDGLVTYAAGAASILAGCILREDPTIYYEGTRPVGPTPWVTYPQRVATPWLINTNLEGWERIYMANGVGDVAGAHTLMANLYRNYDDADAVGAYRGDFAEDDKWIWRLRPRVQKLGSMKLELSVYEPPGEEPTAGAIIEAAVFVIGIKGGTTRRADGANLKPF